MRGWRRIALAILLLGSVGTAQAQLNANGGDAQRVGDTIVTHLDGRTLYIPKGYVSGLMGFAGNVQINALLPCLLPETPENAVEFQSIGMDGRGLGNILIAYLTTSDRPWVSSQEQIDTAIDDSNGMIEYLKKNQPESPEINTVVGPKTVPGSKYVTYLDLLIGRSLYVLPGSDPLLVVSCARSDDPNPLHADVHYCEVLKQVLGNMPVHYVYNRSYIERDPDNAAKIDERIQHLLTSFLTPTPASTNKTCK